MCESVRPLFLVACFLGQASAADPAVHVWTRQEAAVIEGRRWDVPLGYDPTSKRFAVLGGRSTWADYKKPRSYDVLSLDPSGKWHNKLPAEKDWRQELGAVSAPAWKDERWGFRDAAGNTRPNWTVYGTFSLGQKYDYDPDTKAFYFYSGGSTFRYDAAKREWKDLAPDTHPEKALGGILLWSSMCYDRSAQKFVLFGGGNIQSERGDPGTWTYSPAGNRWEQLKLDRQPPARANSRLVYDPVNQKVVCFGGDRLDRLTADTWLFDTAKQTWEERKPAISPAPRAGHAFLWLPKAKKILLLGGYTYTSTTDYCATLYRPLPLEAWTYDVASNRWDLLARWEKSTDAPQGPTNFFLSAAVDENDNVLVLDSQNRAWSCKFDATKVDGLGTAKYGEKPGTIVSRTGSHDPAWYREAARPKPGEDPKIVQANRWMIRQTPNRPLMNMDWGSAIFDPANDLIVRFSGGHSAYSGTAPQVYNVKTDRYSIPFAPEYPIEYVYSNDQVHGEWSFQGRPWMTGHTYKSTGYDLNLKLFVFAPHDYTYFFDTSKSSWSRSATKNPYRPDFYTVTLCSTPGGAMAWGVSRETGKDGLWLLDVNTKNWKPQLLRGELPTKSADRHGMAHDSKRDRLLMFSDHGPKRGNVAAYDSKTGEAKWLDPVGMTKALVHCRETAYIPEADLVLIGGRVQDEAGAWQWLAYDCAANAWVSIDLAGDDPIGKRSSFNNSMGLMYDPNRKLIWAVGQHSQVYILSFDAKTARITPLK